MSERASEMAAVVGTVDPTTAMSSGTVSTDIIDMSKFDSVLFVVQTGYVSCSGTAASKTTFTANKGTSTGTVATSVGTSTISLESDHLLLYEVDAADLGGANYRYIQGKVKFDDKAAHSVVALGFKPRYHPASDSDLAEVESIGHS